MAFDQSSAGSYTYGLWANSPNNVAVYGSSGHDVAAQFQYGSAGLGQCYFAGGPGWSCSSDRDIKEAFVPVDGTTLLDKLAGLPVFEYAMRGSTDKARYLGPTAQDFQAAFHLGTDERTINTANAQGVALAAAKGLYVRLKAVEATLAAQNEKIASLEAQLAETRTAMAGIGAMTASLEQLQATVDRLSRTRPLQEASLAGR